jgi:predicted TIM-barrel fold metal-dependent hydrolase
VRIALRDARRLGETDREQQFFQPFARAAAILRRQRFADLAADGEDRIEAFARILEDVGQAAARPARRAVRPADFALVLRHAPRQQPAQRRGRHALAAAAFPHQRRRPPRAQPQIHPRHHLQPPALLRKEADAEPRRRQYGFGSVLDAPARICWFHGHAH